MRNLIAWFVVLSVSLTVFAEDLVAEDHLRVGTWNVEHLGSSGRGFGGGFGAGSVPRRTDAQLREIGAFVRDTLDADVLALQEIAVSEVVDGLSRSEQLDVVIGELGAGWDYYLPWVAALPPDANNAFNALLWNGNSVNLLNAFAMEVPDLELAGEPLFKRKPLVGYFEALNNGSGTNDFVMVNVHLASGQTNDENHIIAMVPLEHGLNAA